MPAGSSPQPAAATPATPARWLWWLALLALTGLAVALRLPHLLDQPFWFNFDEGHYAWDATRILDGWRPAYLPGNNGREPLFVYMLAAVFALLGPTLLAARLTGLLANVLALPAQAVFVRGLPLPRPGVTALLSAALLAIGFWPLVQSHQSLRAGFLPVWVALLLWAWWRTIDDRQPTTKDKGQDDQGRRTEATKDQGPRTNRSSLVGPWSLVLRQPFTWSMLTGLILAAALYTYLSARFLPIPLVVSAAWVAWRRRRLTPLAGLAVTLTLAGVLVLPQALVFRDNPDLLLRRAGQVSLLDPANHKGDLVGALGRSGRDLLLAANVRGSRDWTENLPGRPIFDPLLGVAFLAGLGLLAWDLLGRRGPSPQDAAVLLVVTLAVSLVPAWLSENAPSYIRLTGTWPILYLLPAWALERGGTWLNAHAGRHIGTAAVALALLVSAAWSLRDFYVTYPATLAAAGTYTGAYVERGEELAAIATEGPTYVTPVLWGQSVTRFLNARRQPTAYDPRAGLVLPAQGDARYIFEAVEAKDADQFATRWPAAIRQDIRNSHGDLSLVAFRLPRAAFPTLSVLDAPRFGGQIRLAGHALAGPSLARGDKLRLTLAWQTDTPIEADLNQFVHVVDATGRTIGQYDGAPLGGSYPTSRWQPGETIVQPIELTIAQDAPIGPATLRVGWYDWRTGARLPLDGDDDSALDMDRVQVTP